MKTLKLILFIMLPFSAFAELRTAKIFGDHMVLQQNKPIVIWGWCNPGATVKVSFVKIRKNTIANNKGRWECELPPMSAGGPYSMSLTSGKEQVMYQDIEVGEVWVCSGQSNMEWLLKYTDNYSAEQKNADKQSVRQFTVPQKMSLVPEEDFESGEWQPANQSSVGRFSAVGYYFAKKLSAELGVNVGIINDSWGGTQAESWISNSALLTDFELADIARHQGTEWSAIKTEIDKKLKVYAYSNQKEETTDTPEQLYQQTSSYFYQWQKGSAGPWRWQGWWGSFKVTDICSITFF